MFIAIDESGNEGFPTKEGQSKWFCLVAVAFARTSRPAIEEAFMGLYQTLGTKEFRFRDDHRSRKRAAIQIMSKLDFKFHMVACDKTRLRQHGWRPKPNQTKPILSEMTAALVSKLTFPEGMERLDVFFDEVGGHTANGKFKKELRGLLRKKVGPDLRMEICAKKSATTPCVQLADYVCGSFMRSIRDDHRSEAEYYKCFKRNEASVTMWP